MCNSRIPYDLFSIHRQAMDVAKGLTSGWHDTPGTYPLANTGDTIMFWSVSEEVRHLETMLLSSTRGWKFDQGGFYQIDTSPHALPDNGEIWFDLEEGIHLNGYISFTWREDHVLRRAMRVAALDTIMRNAVLSNL